MSIRHEIEELVVQTAREVLGDKVNAVLGKALTVERPPSGVAGDFATNAALISAKAVGRPPREIASDLAAALRSAGKERGLLDDAQVAGPGFVNVWLRPDRLAAELAAILREGTRYGSGPALGGGRRVLIEFVSANPTGPLHIGHARSAALGDALANIMGASGWQVEREYYINDIGRQIRLLGESLKTRWQAFKSEGKADTSSQPGNATKPDAGSQSNTGTHPASPGENKTENDNLIYRGDYLVDIARLLQDDAGSWPLEKFSDFAMEYLLKSIRSDLEEFGVHFDNWVYEHKLYPDIINHVITILKQKNYAYEQDGALWLKCTDFGDDKDRVIIRSTKEPTYLASDIGYHHQKFQRGYDMLIDIWGADHHGYVSRLKASQEALGYNPDVLHIILYQLVNLWRGSEKVIMSTRAGEFVTMKEVIDEVGADACRWFLLSRNADAAIDFDLALAKEQSAKNPVYYIQYSHARISSIFREAENRGVKYEPDTVTSSLASLLTQPEEAGLMKHLACFPDMLEMCAQAFEPSSLTGYLLELARKFHEYYEKHRILGIGDESLTQARLVLCDCVKTVISDGLKLLGITAPERM